MILNIHFIFIVATHALIINWNIGLMIVMCSWDILPMIKVTSVLPSMAMLIQANMLWLMSINFQIHFCFILLAATLSYCSLSIHALSYTLSYYSLSILHTCIVLQNQIPSKSQSKTRRSGLRVCLKSNVRR